LSQAHELGTPLSGSFEGFGADGSGRLSVQQLHAALKNIGQFRWTTLGEVKGFIRLLQEDEAEVDAARRTSSSDSEVFLTLPALEAFVEGGDAFLARKERAALARRQSQEALLAKEHAVAEAAAASPTQASSGAAGASRTRANSWFAGEDEVAADTNDIRGAYGKGTENERELLERLRVVLARAAGKASRDGEDSDGCGGASLDDGGVRGYLDSFDVDGDGVMRPEELVASLRSLGARGREFHGRKGVNALLSLFCDGTESPAAGARIGASVVKIAWWFAEQVSSKTASASAAAERNGGRSSSNVRSGMLRGEPGDDRVREEISRVGAGDALRRAVGIAEAKGTTMERTFARLDDDGDGFITLRQLLRGLDQLGVFEMASRDDVLDALDELDADRQSSRPSRGRKGEESKDGGGDSGTGGVDLVAFIRLMRHRPRQALGAEETNGSDIAQQEEKSQESEQEATYEYSLDPDTKAAEKKLRRVVAKQVWAGRGSTNQQVRLGVDVEGVFRRHDPDQSGSLLRSDFVQAVMELGVGLLDSSNSRHVHRLAGSPSAADPVRRRQLGQLARAKGPVERRLMRMRQTKRGLLCGGRQTDGGVGEAKGDEHAVDSFEGGDESLALIQWYREGQKKSMVRHILATSLTTEYNLFFAFASPLFFEHPLRNPFNHEERFRIDLDDHQLRVVTGTSEWAYLRRHASPCVGDLGDSPVETDFFDVDPQRGVEITLMAHEVVFIPFAFLCLEPHGVTPAPSTPPRPKRSSRGRAGGMDEGRASRTSMEGGAGTAERSAVVAFVSTSHGHVVSIMQVHLQRREFVVNRTFRFYQSEGEILKRSIQLLPGGGPEHRLSKHGKGSLGVGGVSREPYGVSEDGGAKYIHCVEEAGHQQGSDDRGRAGGGVVIEWARRAAAMGGGAAG
ncbi:unnamed protein product, partial [Ectocarpus sp. 12 AP-2014]